MPLKYFVKNDSLMVNHAQRVVKDSVKRNCFFLFHDLVLDKPLKAYARIRELTGPAQCWKPPKVLILEINRYLEGWAQYFRRGYPRRAFRNLNGYACLRLSRHMHRRSQRPWRPPKDATAYAQFHRLGLIYL